jgi:CRP-like cAMP-binding protein
MTVTPDLLRRVSLFGELLEAELVEIMGCFTEVRVEPGEFLYEEGNAATDACFLLEGELEAVKALPGGGETQLGLIAPGAMIGEMALVAGGTRTASVRARRRSEALAVSYYFFHAALNQMSVPAFKILRAVMQTMVARLGEVQERILIQWGCDGYVPGPAMAGPPEPSGEAASFDYRPFLPILPCFKNFDEGEIDGILAEGELLEMPRGGFLFREGAPPGASYLVLRGAIEHSVMRDRRYQLAVLGPGRLSGSQAAIGKTPHVCDARVRSDALLLRFGPAAFDRLFLGDETCCLKFQNLISADLLLQLRASANLLAQLVSQSYAAGEPRARSL